MKPAPVFAIKKALRDRVQVNWRVLGNGIRRDSEVLVAEV